MSVSFCLSHPVAVSAFMICRSMCACTEMLWMCVLYVSFGSKVRPRTSVNCVQSAVRHRGDVCCSVVFGTLVGVFVFSVMWSDLLMTSAISCPLWSSVYECQRVECAFTSLVRTERGMFVMYAV